MNFILVVCHRIYHSTISAVLILTAGILMMNLLPTNTTEDGQYVTDGEVTQKVTKASYPTLY